MDANELKKLREIAAKSTRVVAWYPHGTGDQCGLDEATVRGPFGRWLYVRGGKGAEPGDGVGSVGSDAKFAAAAMNNLVPLLDALDQAEADAAAAEEVLHGLANRHWGHPDMGCCVCEWHNKAALPRAGTAFLRRLEQAEAEIEKLKEERDDLQEDLDDSPDWLHCIKGSDDKTMCGLPLPGWHFTGFEHAVASIEQGCRLLPCPICLHAAHKAKLAEMNSTPSGERMFKLERKLAELKETEAWADRMADELDGVALYKDRMETKLAKAVDILEKVKLLMQGGPRTAPYTDDLIHAAVTAVLKEIES